MNESSPVEGAELRSRETGGLRRADAVASRERILTAAKALAGDPSVSMAEIAAAAGVGRSTLYRHFPTRGALRSTLDERVSELEPLDAAPPQVATLGFQAPGHLGRDHPLPLEVTRILDEVPPHLVPDQLVAEARRAGRVGVALYVVDIDGSHLLRLAGSEEFPERIDSPPALGPEIAPEGLPAFAHELQQQLPGCVLVPLWLRGRVTALLLCLGTPVDSLTDIARQGAAALELANDYTDFIEAARRRKPTTPAAEIQQNLFPPRIARVAGAQLAGVLLPSYAVGGDWFDFVENRDGAWLAIADASGNGPTAAGLGAAALGALRAARRSGGDLQDALREMHETVRRFEHPGYLVSALVARWRPATATLNWVNCGHQSGYVINTEGELEELGGPVHPALGGEEADPVYAISQRRLRSGERLVLLTDGVTARHVEGGGTFGVERLRAAIEAADHPTATGTARAIQDAVTSSWREPLEDDATVVVMAVA
jgi:serine phosphatase RsbU (regulator of sigma subunit)